MPKLTQLASAMALLSLLSACQEQSTELDESKTKVQQTAALLAPPQNSDLVSDDIAIPSLPPLNTRQDTISFVTALPRDLTVAETSSDTLDEWQQTMSQTRKSDEYWMTVSGESLNKGLVLPITQGASVIRIAPRADTSSGGLIHADPISPENVELFTHQSQDKNPRQQSQALIKSMADPAALATAGLVDDSSALVMSAEAKPGQYTLKVKQPLGINSNYLVNVKEKNSPYQLTLTAPNTLKHSAEAMAISLELSQAQMPLSPKAKLKLADGSSVELVMQNDNGQWRALMPAVLPEPSSNAGLSELQIDAESMIDGHWVKRTVKTAFKQYVDSAKIKEDVTINWQKGVPTAVTFTVETQTAARYGINAVLVGHDADGKTRAILRSQTAAWLTPDTNQLTLALDQQLILASGLLPPYELKGLELQDQGQMARISYQSHGLTLTE